MLDQTIGFSAPNIEAMLKKGGANPTTPATAPSNKAD